MEILRAIDVKIMKEKIERENIVSNTEKVLKIVNTSLDNNDVDKNLKEKIMNDLIDELIYQHLL